MTPKDVLAVVATLNNDDPESSHGTEDGLYCSVLRAIADGHEDPAALAAAALTSRDLDLIRWYA